MLYSLQALDLDSSRDDRLSPVIEELSDLKAVWTALSGVWAQIADIREMSWSTIQVRLPDLACTLLQLN